MTCILKCFLEYICEHKEIIVSILTFFVALLTLCVTKEISFNQQWNTLVSEYRSTDFGVAIKSICDFYIDKCGSDLSNIEIAYFNQYVEESNLVLNQQMRKEDTLQFKRRLVSQYYWHLENSLGNKSCKHKKSLEKYFNE